VRLTPAGRAFLPDARRILALTEGAVSAAQRISKGECGVIRIGFTAGSSYSFLPRLLAQAKVEFKDVGMVLNEMVTMQQMESRPELRPQRTGSGNAVQGGVPGSNVSWYALRRRQIWCVCKLQSGVPGLALGLKMRPPMGCGRY
jgi:hypothetical protein